MIVRSCLLVAALFAFISTTNVNGELVISQYVDTDSGTTPKGIELWNSGGSAIVFSATNGLDVLQGTNGGALASKFTLNSGTLGAGQVMVIGTADIGTYLDTTFGAGVIQFHEESFTFNGNDALQIQLGGSATDTFGLPGNDPGTHWSGPGVSTRDSNIALLSGITAGDLDGFTDPSGRFSTISTNPSGAGGLAGFGVTPVPEPTTFVMFGTLVLSGLGFRRRT